MTLTISPFLCIAASILGFAMWFRRKKSKLEEFMSSLPSPKALPLIGHTHLLIAPSMREMYNATMRLLNDRSMYKMVRLTLPLDDFVCVNDAHIMQTILRSPQCQVKYPAIYDLFHMPGSLFTGNGKEWLDKRNTAAPGFHSKIMASLDTFYQQRSDQFLDSLSQYADSGEIFDLLEEQTRFSLDLLCGYMYVQPELTHNQSRPSECSLPNMAAYLWYLWWSMVYFDTFMGVSLDVQKRKDQTLASHIYDLPDTIITKYFVPMLQHRCIYSIVRRWEIMIEKFFKCITALATEVVTKRMQYRASLGLDGNYKGVSLESGKKIYLDILLDKLETEGEDYLDGVLKGIIEIFEAGVSTTASITCWVLMLSGVLPEVGDKLHAEIEEFFGSGEERMDIKNCAKLEYLDMVIKEALRHFGVPFVFRQPLEDVSVKDIGTIPAGTKMMLSLHTLHHHPSYWERPLEFYPEHFLPENVAKRPKSAFVPFLNGARNCIGAQYAMQTMKCQLTQILSKVKFKAAKMKSWTNFFNKDSLKFGFAQIPADGFFVTIEFKDKRIN